MVTGTNPTFVSANGHRPIPTIAPGARPTHGHTVTRKPTGLDWDTLRPKCTDCGQPSGQLDHTDTCPGCRGTTATPTQTPTQEKATAYGVLPDDEVQRRFTAPATPRENQPCPTAPSPPATPAASPSSPPAPAPLKVGSASPSTGGATQAHHNTATSSGSASASRPSADTDLTSLVTQALRAIAAATTAVEDLQSAIRDHQCSPDRPTADPTGKPIRRPAHTPGGTARPRGRTGSRRIQLPTTQITAAYQAGTTTEDIAADHGVSHMTIIRVLKEAGIPRRGAHIARTPELVEQIRHLYIDENLTQSEVADHIGCSSKVIQAVLAEHNIPTRPAAPRAGHGGQVMASIRGRLTDLGVTARQVKDWALDQGLIDHVTRGVPSRHLIDAYAAAHPSPGAAA